jgi:signal transduction histidine kinase
MSVRWKIVRVLIVVTLLYAVVDNLSLRYLFARNTAALERHQVHEAEERLHSMLEREKTRLAELAAMHARLIQPGAAQEGAGVAVSAGLSAELLASLRVHALFVCRADGTTVVGSSVDPVTARPIRVRELPGEAPDPSHPALSWIGDSQHHEALALTEAGVMVVASRRVAHAPGTPALTVVLGRFLGPDLERELAVDAGGLVRLSDCAASPELTESLRAAEGQLQFEALSSETLRCRRLLPDWNAVESILLEIDVPRTIAKKNASGVNYALLSSMATALVLLLVLAQLLERTVIRPLFGLQKAVMVADDRRSLTGFELERDDELGQLGREFDSMLRRLAELRDEASLSARRDGMSEIAVSVLHEVGNTLNSVTVSAGMLRRYTQALGAQDLQKVAGVLETQAHDLPHFLTQDGRGRFLIPCLRDLGNVLVAQQQRLLQELDTLDQHVGRMATSVSAQQSRAEFHGVPEQLSLPRTIEEALALALPEASASLEVLREYEDVPETLVDRHRLLEVLVILLRSAYRAVLDSGREDKEIVLRVRRVGTERLGLEIQDNCSGMSREDLTRAFDGELGRLGLGPGLHQAANLATELKGFLSAESAGPGTGTCYCLELPLRLPESGDVCRIRPQPVALRA